MSEVSNTPKKRHGNDCGCQFCSMIRQGWWLISPDGHVFHSPKGSPEAQVAYRKRDRSVKT